MNNGIVNCNVIHAFDTLYDIGENRKKWDFYSKCIRVVETTVPFHRRLMWTLELPFPLTLKQIEVVEKVNMQSNEDGSKVIQLGYYDSQSHKMVMEFSMEGNTEECRIGINIELDVLNVPKAIREDWWENQFGKMVELFKLNVVKLGHGEDVMEWKERMQVEKIKTGQKKMQLEILKEQRLVLEDVKKEGIAPNQRLLSPGSIRGKKEFKFEFVEQDIGITLGLDFKTEQLMIEAIRKGSEADKRAKLNPGVVLYSIQGKYVDALSVYEATQCIEHMERPIWLGFYRPVLKTPKLTSKNSTGLEKFTNIQGQVVVFVPATFDLKSCFSNQGMVMEECTLTVNGATGPDIEQEQMNIPAMMQLIEVDGISTVRMDQDEIIRIVTRKVDRCFRKLVLENKSPAQKKKVKRSFSFRQSRVSRTSTGSLSSTAPSPIGSPIPNTKFISKCLMDYSTIIVSESNLEWALDHIELLMGEERIVSAGLLIEKLQKAIENCKTSNEQLVSVKARLSATAFGQKIERTKHRKELALACIHDFCAMDDDAGWIYAQTHFGVTTHWKKGDHGTIWLKLQGNCQDLNVLDNVAVVRETDLYDLWAPFCNQAQLLATLDRIEIVTYLKIALPLLARDAVIHAFGVNATYEYGCVVIIGDSVDEWENVIIPPIKGWNCDRMIIRGFRAMIKPISRTSAQIVIVANIDPKCPIPQSLLNFCTKKLAGVLLYLLMKEAEKIGKHPETNPYAIRMREDPSGFYKWLRPRMNLYFDHLEENTLPNHLPIMKGEKFHHDSMAESSEVPKTTNVDSFSSAVSLNWLSVCFPMLHVLLFTISTSLHTYCYLDSLHFNIAVGFMWNQSITAVQGTNTVAYEKLKTQGLRVILISAILCNFLVLLITKLLVPQDMLIANRKSWIFCSCLSWGIAMSGMMLVRKLQR